MGRIVPALTYACAIALISQGCYPPLLCRADPAAFDTFELYVQAMISALRHREADIRHSRFDPLGPEAPGL